MATYDDWNRKLVDYSTAGSPHGVAIYLSIDSESLNRIGRAELALPAERGMEDFCQAVRERVVSRGKVNLRGIDERDAEGQPTSVAFLAAMVLAASFMEDSELSGSIVLQTNYFRRLREVLNLDVRVESGRPQGMEGGAEEVLWQDWGRWLQQNGFLPSARGGEGAFKYINYPISQALLREADKRKLRNLFTERGWRQDWDAETLTTYVLKEADRLSQHLRDILQSHDLRFEAAMEDIHELYELWRDEVQQGPIPPAFDRGSRLYAGLYRSEDSFQATVEYWLYPHRPRRADIKRVIARIHETPVELEADQPGWYMPAVPVGQKELSEGARYPILEPASLESLVLPKRRFWILVPDPDDPDSGVYASWGSPPPGTPFMLLCRADLLPQMRQLREERLIEWSGDPVPRYSGGMWMELQYCMVVSQAWSGIFADDRELFEALRPNQSLSIGLSGGLRAPGQRSWLEGAEPHVTVFGFPSQAHVQMIRVADDKVVDDRNVRMRAPFTFNWLGPGDYRIEAESLGESTMRLVKVLSWDHLSYTSPQITEVIDLGDWHLCGAWLQEKIS